MLSYRHAFHAGNHADVLKHLIEVLVLDYLRDAKPDKPLCYIDTHAGPGGYSLVEGYATRKAEHESGIGRLWRREDLPAPLARYREAVRSFNPGGALVHYPGSPAIARYLLRGTDRLELLELHSTEFAALQKWAAGDKRIHAQHEDGFQRLASLLPPKEKRGLILIDPPYEVKSDYEDLPNRLRAALKRFASGVYLLWYPMLSHPEAALMAASLPGLCPRWLRAELQVKEAGPGLYGSGMFVVNPPWTLESLLRECMAFLCEAMRQDRGARYALELSGSG